MRPTRRSGTGREAHPEVRKACPKVREWLGGPLEVPGKVGMPSCRSVRGWEVHLKGRERLGGPPGRPIGVRRPIQRPGRSWEAYAEVRYMSGGSPGGL